MPKYFGIDLASGPDETHVVIRGQRGGKSEEMRRYVEQALNAGATVHDCATGETRGPGVARDVTPTPPKQIEKPSGK